MRLLALAAALLLWPAAALAQEAGQFLRVQPSARPMALGEAYTAVADDLSSLGTNPAGLAAAKSRQAAFSHAELVAGTRYDFAAFSHPLAPGSSPLSGGTLGVGLQRLSHGALSGRDESGRATGDFGASDTAVSLAYSRRLVAGLSGGATVKFIDSRLADASARTIALDAGLQRPVAGAPVPLTLGVAVLNAGGGLRLGQEVNPLPLTISFGAATKLAGSFLLSADVRHRPHESKTAFGVGTEYALLSGFALRAGYAARSAVGGSGAGPGSGLAMGFGLRVFKASLDYAFSPYGELGAASRLTLATRF